MLFQPAASGVANGPVRPRYVTAFDIFAFAIVFGLMLWLGSRALRFMAQATR